jgi:hypothetical protein
LEDKVGSTRIDLYLTPTEKRAIEDYVAQNRATKITCRSVSWFCRQAALAALARAKRGGGGA